MMRETFSVRAIAAGTALAATVYIGFDGVAFWRKRWRIRSAMCCWLRCWYACLRGWFRGISGLSGGASLAGLPDAGESRNGRLWMWLASWAGYKLFVGFGAVLLISSLACGLAGLLGAVRLLYSMGRDNVLPRKILDI